jgi:hypothetical protein
MEKTASKSSDPSAGKERWATDSGLANAGDDDLTYVDGGGGLTDSDGVSVGGILPEGGGGGSARMEVRWWDQRRRCPAIGQRDRCGRRPAGDVVSLFASTIP